MHIRPWMSSPKRSAQVQSLLEELRLGLIVSNNRLDYLKYARYWALLGRLQSVLFFAISWHKCVNLTNVF
jgi:hypothetical protein